MRSLGGKVWRGIGDKQELLGGQEWGHLRSQATFRAKLGAVKRRNEEQFARYSGHPERHGSTAYKR